MIELEDESTDKENSITDDPDQHVSDKSPATDSRKNEGEKVEKDDEHSFRERNKTSAVNCEKRRNVNREEKQRLPKRFKPSELEFKESQRSALKRLDEDMIESLCSCFICGHRTSDVHGMETHMLEHSLFLCPTCERCFKYKRSYQNHRFICEDRSKRNRNQGFLRKIQEAVEITTRRSVRRLRQQSGDELRSAHQMPLARTRRTATTVKEQLAEAAARRNMAAEVEGFRNSQQEKASLEEFQRNVANDTESKSKAENKEKAVDCDLRTLAMAAASVAPHSKAAIDLLKNDPLNVPSKPNQNAFVPDISHLQSPFPPQFMLPGAFMPPNGNPREPLFLWQGVEIRSETQLFSKVDGYNPLTEQQYLLYKCSICTAMFPSLPLVISHVGTHNRSCKEHCCEKCGALFKWRSQLEVHDQVHMVMDNMALINRPPLFNPLLQQGSFEDAKTPSPFEHHGHPFYRNLMPLREKPSKSSSPASRDDHEDIAAPTATIHDAFNSRCATGFMCNFCSKTFDRLFSLQRHERIHTGIKICFCKHCGRGFSERRNLRHHIIRFHSDNSQRDTLRRTLKPKPRKRASSRSNPSHKLVSFLKKTAVRILNTMEQSKYNSLDKLTSSTEDLSNMPLDQKQCLSTDKVDQSDTSNVTVVLPTDVDNQNEASNSAGKEKKEVMEDPKRSLIGSRRKGRPFRYTPTQPNVDDSKEDSDDGSSKTDNLVDPVQFVKQEMECISDDNSYGYDMTQNHSSGNDNSEDAIHADIPLEASPHFKRRLRGHGSFFSNYNPRLGVVNSPVARSQACRPQISSDGKYVYPCSYCYKTFCSTSDLNRHMDFHEDVRPFKCPYCTYFSRTNSQLKVHMMRHQGIKQFLCSLCNYNGVTQSDLNRHCKTRSHILKELNSCNACGVGFYTCALLEEHMRLVDHSGENRDSSILPMEYVATSYEFIKKENDEEDLAEVISIDDAKGQSEANNNDYEFNTKNTRSSTKK